MPRPSRAVLTAALAALALLVTPTAALAVDDPPPAPVSGLTVTGDASSVTLAWTLPTDADLARVVVRRSVGSVTAPATPTDGEEVASGLISTWTDHGDSPVRDRGYSVFAQDAAGQWSSPVTTRSRDPRLGESDLAASSDLSSVTVTWSPPAAPAEGVRIRRVDCGRQSVVIAIQDVPRDTTSWTVGGLSRGTEVCVRAQQFGADGREAVTPTAVDRTIPVALPVTGLSASATGSRVRLAWTLPDDPDVTGVEIRRTADGMASTTAVVHRGTGTAWADTGVTPQHHYAYDVRTVTAAGRTSEPAETSASTDFRWASAVVAPDRGRPIALSCPTTTWCMSFDASGRYQVLSGSSWSTARAVPSSATVTGWLMSCPEKGWCLARSGDGVRIFSAGRWSAPTSTPQPATTRFDALTCTSRTWCIAMLHRSRVSVFTGTRWTSPTYFSGLRSVTFDDIACQTTRRCFAVGTASDSGPQYRATLASGHWSTARLASGWSLVEVDCPSTSACVAVSEAGTWTVSGTTWTTHRTPMDFDGHLSCTSRTSCISLDGAGRSRHWSGSAWSSPGALSTWPARVTGVDCVPGSSTCHAVDDRGRHFRWTPTTHWRSVSTYDAPSGGLGDPSCVSSSLCFAVDDGGWMYRFDGTRWARGSRLFTAAASLSCVRSGACLALQQDSRRYRTYRSGSWGTTRLTPSAGYGRPSCASSTSCSALDDDGRAWRFTGSTWTRTGRPFDSGAESTVSCPSTSFCLAVSGSARWSRWNGSRWSSRAALPSALTSAGPVTSDCSSSTSCLAVAWTGATATWNGSTWRLRTRYGPTAPDLACVSSTWCLGTNHDGASTTLWTGTYWTTTDFERPPAMLAVDCPSTAFCVTTGGSDSWWTVPGTTG